MSVLFMVAELAMLFIAIAMASLVICVSVTLLAAPKEFGLACNRQRRSTLASRYGWGLAAMGARAKGALVSWERWAQWGATAMARDGWGLTAMGRDGDGANCLKAVGA